MSMNLKNLPPLPSNPYDLRPVDRLDEVLALLREIRDLLKKAKK